MKGKIFRFARGNGKPTLAFETWYRYWAWLYFPYYKYNKVMEMRLNGFIYKFKQRE